MPAASFQVILDKALADYCEQIGVELDKHPVIDELRGRDSPDNVLKLLEEKANAFKVYRDGNRKLINWLSPVVQVVHTISGVLGQAVPFQPAQAIFAGVDVLITAADGVSSSYDALVDLFECIGNFLNRLRIYTDIPLTPSMTEIIVKIMVELLSVLALATKQIKQGRFKKFAKKLLGESEIEAVLQRLDRLTLEEGRMTVAQTLEVVHGLVNNVKVVMNDGKASTDGIRKALDVMQQMSSDINKIRRDQMQIASKSWLCPPDPSKNYNIGCKTHQDGTATWFFQGDVFDEWNAKGSLLWIHGKPGAGKSILLSSIIRKIDIKRKAGLASMAYFYFDFRDAEKQHLRGLLSSLVFQLSAKSDPCYQILSRLYSDHAGGAEEPSEDALSECLVKMLEVPGQPSMYIIIDAIDECPNISGLPTAREQVLAFLEHLVNLNLPNVHICASSRPEIDIRDTLEPLAPFHMSLHDESGQREDISSYINAVVQSNQRMRKWRKGDKQLVIDTLSDKADGMFRWVYCQLEVLRWTLPVDIRSALNDIPKTLDETYERALLAINAEMRQYAQRLFQCLAVSIRPLRVEELADVLAVRFNAGALPKFSPDWRLGDAEDAVLSVCSNLISVVDVDGSQVVQFSHFSVKEFLTSNRLASAGEDISGYHIVLQSAHTILAQACLSVLLQLDDHIDKDSIKNFPLSCYAAQHWVEHGQFEGVSSTIQVAMEHLFDPDKPQFSTWVWLYDVDNPWRGEMPTAHPQRLQAAPLYYAVLCGFRQLIEHLISSYPGDVDARGGYHETPLLAAFIKEDTDVALSLLQRGADVNMIDKSGTSPLHRASQSGDIDTVRTLLEHNAAVDLSNILGDTPFILACAAGEMGVSHLLEQRGADVNLQNPLGASPLHVATGGGYLDIVRFLIECGAQVNTHAKQDWTPLHSASYHGHVKIAELLIQSGADVGARDVYGRTPLYAASQGGHVQMVELLTQHGADVGSRDNDGLTLLHAASYAGHVKIAELFIQSGTDVGSRNNNGLNPLHMASYWGHVETAELFIQCGAVVGSRENGDWTPLHSASQQGHTKIARLLIQHGADVDSRDNDGQTPLHLAALNGHIDTTKFLIECGADRDIVDHKNRTPLSLASDNDKLDVASFLSRSAMSLCGEPNTTASSTNPQNQLPDAAETARPPGGNEGSSDDKQTESVYAASSNGQIDVVRSLLDRGSDVEERNDLRETPLAVASRSGHLEVARLLIERDADVNSRDADGWTPLHLASRYGHLDLVRLLLDHKADPNARERDRRTALGIASWNGYLDIVELLLERGATANVRNAFGRSPRQEAVAMQHSRIAELLLRHGVSQ